MAKTIILKDIDNNICYPKTIKNNIYGLVSELNEIKQAIGIEPPDNIIVLFKGSTNPSTTMSDFGDNVKLGDLYLKTSASKTMYYVSDMDNQNDTIAWTELADQNSVSRVVQDVLSTDTQVGASLADNTGFISALATNETFATTFLSATGASVAAINASFGSAIACNQAMLNYWFGSVFHSYDGNLLSWLLSSGATAYQNTYWAGIYSRFSSQFAPAIQSCFSNFDTEGYTIQTFFAEVIGYNGSQFGNDNNQNLFQGIINGLYTLSISANKSNLMALLNKRYDVVGEITSSRSEIIKNPSNWYYSLYSRADKIVAYIHFDCVSSGVAVFSPFSNLISPISIPFGGSNASAKVVIDPIASILSYALMNGSYISSSTVWFVNKNIASYVNQPMVFTNVSSDTIQGNIYLKI